jgi:hypothetical protein
LLLAIARGRNLMARIFGERFALAIEPEVVLRGR